MNCFGFSTEQSTPNFSTVSLNHKGNVLICGSSNCHQYLPEFIMSQKRDLLLFWKIRIGRGMFFLLRWQHFYNPDIYVKLSWSVTMGEA